VACGPVAFWLEVQALRLCSVSSVFRAALFADCHLMLYRQTMSSSATKASVDGEQRYSFFLLNMITDLFKSVETDPKASLQNALTTTPIADARDVCCACLQHFPCGLTKSHYISYSMLRGIGHNEATSNREAKSTSPNANSTVPFWTRYLLCGGCESMQNEAELATFQVNGIRIFPSEPPYWYSNAVQISANEFVLSDEHRLMLSKMSWRCWLKMYGDECKSQHKLTLKGKISEFSQDKPLNLVLWVDVLRGPLFCTGNPSPDVPFIAIAGRPSKEEEEKQLQSIEYFARFFHAEEIEPGYVKVGHVHVMLPDFAQKLGFDVGDTNKVIFRGPTREMVGVLRQFYNYRLDVCNKAGDDVSVALYVVALHVGGADLSEFMKKGESGRLTVDKVDVPRYRAHLRKLSQLPDDYVKAIGFDPDGKKKERK
jgi:hypothetical protein